MLRAVSGLLLAAAVCGCSPWAASESAYTTVSGEQYRVFYLKPSPGVFDMKVSRFSWSDGVSHEEKEFTVRSTGAVANELCHGRAELVSVERSLGSVPYEARWRCAQAPAR